MDEEDLELIELTKKYFNEYVGKGIPKEKIIQALKEKGYPIECLNEQPKTDHLIWCHQCKQKVKVVNSVLVKKEVKSRSIRYFLTGECSLCNRRVCGLVSANIGQQEEIKQHNGGDL